MAEIRIKRGTKAQIEAAKTASGLAVAEPYLITDEERLAIGTATGDYREAVMQHDAANYPTIRPSLNLDFVNAEQLDPRITFTRASTATRFNKFGLLEEVAINEPRIDYDPVTGECLGLLIEEQRTNLLTYSEQFDNAAWTKTRSSISANATTAPDGTLTADKLVEDTTESNTHYIQQSWSLTSGTAYTWSAYVKSGERSAIRILFAAAGFTSNLTANFDITSGQWRISSPAPSANLTLNAISIGDGWYRISATATATASASSPFQLYLLDTASSIGLYTGDGTSGIFIWGAQLEAV